MVMSCWVSSGSAAMSSCFTASKLSIHHYSSPGPPSFGRPDTTAFSKGSLQDYPLMDEVWDGRDRHTTSWDLDFKQSLNDGRNYTHFSHGWLEDVGVVGETRTDKKDVHLKHGQQSSVRLSMQGHDHGSHVKGLELSDTNGWRILSPKEMVSSLEALGDVDLPIIDIIIVGIQKCKQHKDVGYAMRLHWHACSIGLDVHIGNYLIPMFVECGFVSYAEQIFHRMIYKNEISWTSLIQGSVDSGNPLKSFDLFQSMQDNGVYPSKQTYVALVKASARLKNLEKGQEFHVSVVKDGFDGNLYIDNVLMDMYARCGSFPEARDLLNEQPARDVVSWTALITGYTEHGLDIESVKCVQQMQREGVLPDSTAFVCGLKACCNMQNVDQGQALHAGIVKEGYEREALVGSTLVDMYAKCGLLQEAQEVFDELPHQNVVLWNVLISGYAEHGLFEECLSSLKQMRSVGVSPDAVTMLASLKACGNSKVTGVGLELHIEIMKQGIGTDRSVCNSLVNMYGKVGLLAEAREVFDYMPVRDVVSWTALIAGYAEHGLGEEAFTCLKQMQVDGVSPNVVTFICCFKACSGVETIDRGREVHAEIAKEGLEQDSAIGNTLVDMYAKCGSLTEAWDMFNELRVQTVVSWSAMILAFTNQGKSEMAFVLYAQMQEQGLAPNSVTFVSILTACSKTAALETGKRIHAQIHIIGRAQAVEVIVSTALIHMYCKCASMEDARQMFGMVYNRELPIWNALITGYSRRGETKLVLELFESMRAQGVRPDGVTFLIVLTACSHGGHVDRGQKYFKVMTEEYGINPTLKHYNCMIELFSRSGQFQDAMTRLKQMPFDPNYATWNIILRACKKWGNVELGRQAFYFAVSLNEKHDSPYILMSQVYENAHMWEDAKRIGQMRMKACPQKEWGKSWIEVDGFVRTFTEGDMEHPQREAILSKLEQLFEGVEESNRVRFEHVLKDLSDNVNHDMSCGHSELVAIACGVINTHKGTTIRVAKNLCVCDYCHSTAALISKVEGRTIICNDARFSHVFRNGNCSCGDCW